MAPVSSGCFTLSLTFIYITILRIDYEALKMLLILQIKSCFIFFHIKIIVKNLVSLLQIT